MIPNQSHSTSAQIINWYSSKPVERRDHMGASLIGHGCDRFIWLSWRWALDPKFDGRMLRLFEFGRQAEPRFVSELRSIGVDVWDADQNGAQWRVSAHGGHFAGSLDGVIKGSPEAPESPAVLECKTHNDKSFKALLSNGVQKSKPQHYDQMMIYCGLMDLPAALYLAENKNDSAVYTEWVEFDRERFDALMARAERLIESAVPPPRLSLDPENFECRWCDFLDHCHKSRAGNVNCRTCCHASPVENAAWRCEHHAKTIDRAAQLAACDSHLMIPALIPFADPQDGGQSYVVYRHKETGALFVNGPRDCTDYGPVYSSEELSRCMGIIDATNDLKNEFPGSKVVAGALKPFDVSDLETHPDLIPVKSEPPAVKAARKKTARLASQITGDRA